jgi:hypothetical protein
MRTRFMAAMVFGIVVALSNPLPETSRAADKDEGAQVEGSGFSLFDTESIVGYDEEKVKKDPVCDPSKRPSIHKVEPDTVKAGDHIVIKGENFGKPECFRGVNFSKASKSKVEYKYVNDSTIEATVPQDAPTGMTFVLTITGAGSAQSKAILVTK